MKIFHDKGVKHVVLTSSVLPDYDDLVMLASEKGTYVHTHAQAYMWSYAHITHTYTHICTCTQTHRHTYSKHTHTNYDGLH